MFAFEEVDFTSPFSIKVVEFFRELFWLFDTDDDEVGVPGTTEDEEFIMVIVDELPCVIRFEDVASSDVLDKELSEVDEVLAYELAFVVVVALFDDDDDIEPLAIVSMYFDV